MLIICPSCATSYNVDLASLSPQGRNVRCLRCRTVWHAAPSHAQRLLAAAEALAPARRLPDDPDQTFAAPLSGFGRVSRVEANPDPSDRDHEMEECFETAAAEQQPATLLDDEAPASAAVTPAWPTEPRGPADIEAPPIAPVDLDQGRPPIAIDPADFAWHAADGRENVETAARRWQPPDASRGFMRWPLSAWHTAIVVLLVIDVFLIGWRRDVVRALPQTASFYALIGMPVNLRGLGFDGVVTAAEKHEGVPILVVEGSIVNDAAKTVEVPRLKFIIRNAARQEIYSWTAVPSTSAVAPGESISFSTRLASPPAGGRDVLVRFVSRRDMIAGLR